MLLKLLEAVCKWPPSFAIKGAVASHPFPFLYAMTQQPSSNTGEVLRNLAATILRFASSSGPYVGNFLSNLETFVSRADSNSHAREHDRGQSNQSLPNSLIESPDEYPSIINETLYATLSQHSRCHCPGDDESYTYREHWARLRLGAKPFVTRNHVVFDILFSAAPARSHILEALWQHLRLQIPKFLIGEQASESESSTKEDHKLIRVENLCSLLGRRLGSVCIRIEMIEGQLHQLFDAEKSDHGLLQNQSVSLSRVLECQRLPTRSKILLAYVLAKSVWQYYDSDFMRAPWTTDSVHFMRESRWRESPNEDINTAIPCLAFNPPSPDQFESAEFYDGDSVLHRYPRVLALAVLLVDIFQNEQNTVRKAKSIEERINNDFMRCHEIVESESWPDLDLKNNDAIWTYKDAVRKCLDPNLFHVSNSPNASSKAAIRKRRNALYTYVVLPLATLCTDAGIVDESDGRHRLTYSETNVESSNASMPALLDSLNKRISSSAIWLESLMSSYLTGLVIKQYRANLSLPRIRIAILDTGYDAGSQFFTATARMRRLVNWKDFVNRQEQPVDRDGHGSHALSLLMKLAPAAEICVARIAENSQDLQSRALSIAQAIEWATNRDGADADIVSMSFGFSEEPLVNTMAVISNAIHKAIHQRNGQVLFFAAAANDGGNQREAFPARHNEVISIRATDYQGAFQHFNPAADALETHIFGTLGTDVPGVWLSPHEEGICKTGTSIATPIVAGIAATILGYARLGIVSNRFDEDAHMERLWTKRGMSLVLMKLAREMGQRRFYIYPQEFYSGMNEKQRDALLLEAMRLV
ncbi:subtilisin-like protein [Trichoderma citrinoviride]|uniref:Subtilisin-like protein n=1 Tax=Trichoderma citrinoviride TaxID=58853 RepID=A0A2T4B832_9HYPO|nr:subtilisin-like protein [Trichoderma citrinoviride]PTB65485.1 subtilisin-like protein [Trichoderma citrinoviride]